MLISLIAAVDEKNGLGKDNQLLCHMPADLKYFKKTTLGKPIIMGYNTFKSIGKALPKRRNIVLSRQDRALPDGVELFTSLEHALATCQQTTEIMIIGGGQLYQQAIAIANRVYLTKIHHQFDADVFFPQLATNQWQQTSVEECNADDNNPHQYGFYIYERKRHANT